MSEVGASLVDEKLSLKIVPKTKVCSASDIMCIGDVLW